MLKYLSRYRKAFLLEAISGISLTLACTVVLFYLMINMFDLKLHKTLVLLYVSYLMEVNLFMGNETGEGVSRDTLKAKLFFGRP